jgi:hypothetical protein
MRRSSLILLPAACLAAVGAMLLLAEREPAGPTRAVPPVDAVERIATPPPRGEMPAAAGSSAVDAETRVDARDNDRATTVRAALGEYLGERNRRPIVKSLTASGLSEVDGELIAARFNLDVAECVLEALRADARARSESFDEVLTGLQMSMAGADVTVGDVIDRERMERIEILAAPCAFDAAQRAGLSLP